MIDPTRRAKKARRAAQGPTEGQTETPPLSEATAGEGGAPAEAPTVRGDASSPASSRPPSLPTNLTYADCIGRGVQFREKAADAETPEVRAKWLRRAAEADRMAAILRPAKKR